jgi:transcriptional regulator with XRE-family HTH domain
MSRYARKKPARLSEKLLCIRESLGLSQNEMLERLGLKHELSQGQISGYELGTREPSLPTLLLYARAGGICVEYLIDDKLNLPKRIPIAPPHRP